MDASPRTAGIIDLLWLLGFGLASSAWCVTAATQLGATFDEPVYLTRGLEAWRTGSHAGILKMGTMPLPVDVTTLPLYLWEKRRGIPFDVQQSMEELLPWARAATLVFWWVLLFYGLLIGRSLAGSWGGRLTVALLACEPNLLGHAGLATTDVAVSACLCAFIHHFRAGRDCGWLLRIGVPGFWFGAAILAKASGLVFGILCMAVVECERLYRLRALGGCSSQGLWQFCKSVLEATRGFRRDAVRIALFGLAVAFIYCGCDWRTQPTFVAWAHGLPEGPFASAMGWLVENLRIFSNAGEGIVRQIKHNLHGHATHLLEARSPRAIWYYFPVLLTIKLTLPVLVTLGVAVVLRLRSLLNWAFLVAVGLMLFSLTCRVQIGIRLILPAIVFLQIGLAAALADLCRDARPWARRAALWTSMGGTAWCLGAALYAWPHGLCYVNPLWGGTANGYHLVSDSNYDWGQGLPELARWQQKAGGPSVDVWYFGTDPILARLPLREIKFHLLSIQSDEDITRQLGGRYLAVSTTLLYGCVDKLESTRRTAAFFGRQPPVGRTTTFMIFDAGRLLTKAMDGAE